MKEALRVTSVLILIILVVPAVCVLSAISALIFGIIDAFTKKITGADEIEKIIEEERKKLEIPDEIITALRIAPKFDYSIFGGYGGRTRELQKNKYLIELSNTTNRRTIAHELFHVYRFLAIQDERGLYFYDELLARIYELFRINLSLKKI